MTHRGSAIDPLQPYSLVLNIAVISLFRHFIVFCYHSKKTCVHKMTRIKVDQLALRAAPPGSRRTHWFRDVERGRNCSPSSSFQLEVTFLTDFDFSDSLSITCKCSLLLHALHRLQYMIWTAHVLANVRLDACKFCIS